LKNAKPHEVILCGKIQVIYTQQRKVIIFGSVDGRQNC